MGKREVANHVDVDAPRPKRRKDTHTDIPSKEEEDTEMVDVGGSSEREDDAGEEGEEPAMSVEEVAEKGLQVWHAVRDAVNKEGRQLSIDFQRLPSKRQYADYYKQIADPISLEEIKNSLDKQGYESLDDLRADFELCFKNARSYNVRESQIWRDAKSLQKTANKEIDKIVGGGEEEGSGGEGGGKRKKKKKPNLTRLMKNRLTKLVSVTDENGASRSDIFMTLPSKKQWGVYYKIIKRPIAFDDIFKRIKRKQYPTLQDFMSDVELVFQNAMEFNTEGSDVWNNAMYLRDYFHKIMRDLPKHFSNDGIALSPTSPEVTHNRITLKLPGLHHAAAAASSGDGTTQTAASGSGTVRLRVPALNGGANGEKALPINGINGTNAASSSTLPAPVPADQGARLVAAETLKSPKAKPKSPAVANAIVPAATASASASAPVEAKSPPAVVQPGEASLTPAMARTIHMALSSAVATAGLQGKQAMFGVQQQQSATPVASGVPTQYAQYSGGGGGYGSTRFYQTPQARPTAKPAAPAQQARNSATPAPAPAPASANLPGPSITMPPPAPRVRADPEVRFVRLVTRPLGRTLELDCAEGVRSWAVRLGAGESKVAVKDVRFAGREKGNVEGSEVEEGATADEMEVDEEGAAVEKKAEPVTPPKKKRGRGRPRKTPAKVPDKEVKPTLVSGKQKTADDANAAAASPSSVEKNNSPGSIAASKAKGKDSSYSPSVEEIIVRLGGVQIGAKEASDSSSTEGEWEVEVGVGRCVLEIGKKGNIAMWKVFIERTA